MKEKDRDVGTRRSLCHCFTPGNSHLGSAPHEVIVIQEKKIISEKKKKNKMMVKKKNEKYNTKHYDCSSFRSIFNFNIVYNYF